LFASSMFYPLDPLPWALRTVSYANPITWQVDLLRYATIGVGRPSQLALEAAGFLAFTVVTFAAALWALRRES
jgi:ABC-type multidrug transport system permease subunit